MNKKEAIEKEITVNFFRRLLYLFLKLFFNIFFFIFDQPDSNRYVEKVKELYSANNFTGWFKKIRFWDAPYKEVERYIPKKGTVLELGCGEGIFTNFIGLSSTKRKIIGIDLDKDRIREANKGLKNVSFKFGDATKIKIPKVDVIIMFHLLHHLLSYDSQEELIKNALKSLNKNGKLVIVEIDQKPFLKYVTSWLTDHFIVALLFEKRFYEPKIFFRKRNDWIKLLRSYGLKVKSFDMAKSKPFSHFMLIASR